VGRLVAKYGVSGKRFTWTDELTANYRNKRPADPDHVRAKVREFDLC